MRSSIVTKRGDKGKTGTLDGRRVSKCSDEMEFMGTLDELQSFLGLIEHETIDEIQRELYTIMGGGTVMVTRLDGLISDLRSPVLDGFILPKSTTHVARAVCRRAERCAVRIQRMGAVPYLNRLSDYLFILSFNL